jgi:hypothetical protein
MKTGTKVVLVLFIAGAALSGVFLFAFFEQNEIGCLDRRAAEQYGWVEVNKYTARNTGVGYSVSAYIPEGRLGDMMIMTYSYPFPQRLIDGLIKELAIQTALETARSSYDMTFTSVERKTERMNGEDAEVIYIDFVAKTPLANITSLNMSTISSLAGIMGLNINATSSIAGLTGMNLSSVSHGKFIIALFSPQGSVRGRFVVIVSYTLIRHEIYMGERLIYRTPESLETYDEMKDLLFNHVTFRPEALL